MSSRKRKHKEKDHSTSSTDSSSEDEKRKEKKRRKKEKKRLKKEKRKKMRKEKKKSKTSADSDVGSSGLKETVSQQDRGRMCPMTKEEWEKQQSVVRRVYDEETGRSRLIKGDGEVLEEIVSKSRHQEINRKATMGDGMSFQSKLGLLKK